MRNVFRCRPVLGATKISGVRGLNDAHVQEDWERLKRDLLMGDQHRDFPQNRGGSGHVTTCTWGLPQTGPRNNDATTSSGPEGAAQGWNRPEAQ